MYDDTKRSRPTKIPMVAIAHINMLSSKLFELVAVDDGKKKSFVFEGDSSATQKVWVDALKAAVVYSRAPTLRCVSHSYHALHCGG